MTDATRTENATPVDAELKARWVNALRTGGYDKATGQLRKTREGGYAYCCLGVACLIAGAEFQDGGSMATYRENKVEDMTEHYMPPLLAAQLGLSIEKEATLASMNDGGKTFGELADYIETLK